MRSRSGLPVVVGGCGGIGLLGGIAGLGARLGVGGVGLSLRVFGLGFGTVLGIGIVFVFGRIGGILTR